MFRRITRCLPICVTEAELKRAAEPTEATPAQKKADGEKAESSHPYVVIPDNWEGYDLNLFAIPSHYSEDLDKILLPSGIIHDRVHKMARDIVADCQSRPLTCLCVLKGGHQFFADLFNEIKQLNVASDRSVPLRIDFIRCKSYHNEESTGKVEVVGGDSLTELEGRNVLIVEDMIDTGKTMVKLVRTLRDYKPADLKVASLFVKRTPASNGYKPHYIGFEVPNHFVVGYALDYNEYFRDLRHVAILNEHGREKYKH